MTDFVWSYWSHPAGDAHRGRWATPWHHLLSWTLSVNLAVPPGGRRILHADSRGARLLADRLKLPFDEVHCTLDRLPASQARFWALGKLHTYRAQERPFVHLDSDAFLWRPLSLDRLACPLLGQNPERFPFFGGYYAVTELAGILAGTGGWMPEELRWYIDMLGNEACCCGVFGGNDLDFIRSYADRAVALVERNQAAWALLSSASDPNVLVEQYYLSASYYFAVSRGTHPGLRLGYLFDGETDAYDPRSASRIGFTHLMWNAKTNPDVLSALERRVARDWPAGHARAAACARDLG